MMRSKQRDEWGEWNATPIPIFGRFWALDAPTYEGGEWLIPTHERPTALDVIDLHADAEHTGLPLELAGMLHFLADIDDGLVEEAINTHPMIRKAFDRLALLMRPPEP